MSDVNVMDEIKKLAEAGDAEGLAEAITDLDETHADELDNLLHRSFQIQRGSMDVPPHPEVIKVIAASPLIHPLIAAIYTEDTQAIKQIVTDDPEALHHRDAKGSTPFLRAAETCKVQVIQAMIELGADIHAKRPNGYAAMHLAAWNEVHPAERVDTLRLLAKAGCDINGLTEHNVTPMMAAAMCFKDNSVACLLELGANASLKSTEDKSALNYAEDVNFEPVIKLLSQ